MKIKTELEKLHEADLWSLMLFVLFKVKDIPEYSSISELAYVLDKENMFKLCEYFGGTTIRIPTIEEFESLLYGMLMYQFVDIEHQEYDVAIKQLPETIDTHQVRLTYSSLKKVLSNYEFQKRSV